MFQFIVNYFRRNKDMEVMCLSVPRSPKWETVRKNFVKKHPKCEVCGTDQKLNVHHIKPFHLDKSLELEPSNLITLCIDHHFLFGHLCDWRAINENVVSDVEMWKQKILNRNS